MASASAAKKSSSSSAEKTFRNEEEIIRYYGQLRDNIQAFHSKITELEGERSEHQLVTEAMREMESSRRCFRMIGGVLVERTVGEVKPAVERNLQGIEGVIKNLKEQLKSQTDELQNLQEKYKIKQVQSKPSSSGAGETGGTGSVSGVLV